MKYHKIKFPKDEGPHRSIVEWWYFNGQLRSGRRKFAYMNCLFKVDPKRINLPFLKRVPVKNFYFSHHLLTDIKKKKFYSEVHPFVVVSEDSFSKDLLFANYTPLSGKGYLNYAIEEPKLFDYNIKTGLFDLNLHSKKKPILVGGKGFLNPKTKMANYYYSLTNLKTKGTINLNGKKIKVKGKSWIDHQWANTPFQKVMWNWFSIQLNNKKEIICFELIHKNNKTHQASIIDKNGKCEHTKRIKLTPSGDKWTSKRTGASYPLSWKIEIPSKNIELHVSPIVEKQEMLFGCINYWEGPFKVKGKINKRKVRGRGFMELVGYEMKKSLIKQYEERIKKHIRKKLRH